MDYVLYKIKIAINPDRTTRTVLEASRAQDLEVNIDFQMG